MDHGHSMGATEAMAARWEGAENTEQEAHTHIARSSD